MSPLHLRLAALALPLLVAACNPPFRTFPPMTDEGCRRTAENDPVAVRERARFATGLQRDSSALEEAIGEAYARCIRGRGGAAARGGVEPVRRGF